MSVGRSVRLERLKFAGEYHGFLYIASDVLVVLSEVFQSIWVILPGQVVPDRGGPFPVAPAATEARQLQQTVLAELCRIFR